MKRPLAAIGFIIGILLPSASAVLMYWAARSQIRHEMKTKIESGAMESSLTLLRIPRSLEQNPNADFKRFHAAEFRYKGVMYDVVRQEVKGDTTWYWCIADWEDTHLQNQWDDYRAQGSRSEQPVQRAAEDRLFKFWQGLFIHELSPSHLALRSGAPVKPWKHDRRYRSVSRPIPQPPPEHFFQILVQA